MNSNWLDFLVSSSVPLSANKPHHSAHRSGQPHQLLRVASSPPFAPHTYLPPPPPPASKLACWLVISYAVVLTDKSTVQAESHTFRAYACYEYRQKHTRTRRTQVNKRREASPCPLLPGTATAPRHVRCLSRPLKLPGDSSWHDNEYNRGVWDGQLSSIDSPCAVSIVPSPLAAVSSSLHACPCSSTSSRGSYCHGKLSDRTDGQNTAVCPPAISKLLPSFLRRRRASSTRPSRQGCRPKHRSDGTPKVWRARALHPGTGNAVPAVLAQAERARHAEQALLPGFARVSPPCTLRAQPSSCWLVAVP